MVVESWLRNRRIIDSKRIIFVRLGLWWLRDKILLWIGRSLIRFPSVIMRIYQKKYDHSIPINYLSGLVLKYHVLTWANVILFYLILLIPLILGTSY